MFVRCVVIIRCRVYVSIPILDGGMPLVSSMVTCQPILAASWVGEKASPGHYKKADCVCDSHGGCLYGHFTTPNSDHENTSLPASDS